MKRIGIVSTAALSLLLGLAIPASTQDEKHDQKDEQKAKPQDEKQTHVERSAKQDEKNVKQEEHNNQARKNAQEKTEAKPQERDVRERAPQAQPESRAHGGGGGRIPADRYQAHFGREHTFRVSSAEYSSRRFQYSGYWFGFAGVWPTNWLYTQDVFVVEIDGVYYLCNANYPGVNIELNITI